MWRATCPELPRQRFRHQTLLHIPVATAHTRLYKRKPADPHQQQRSRQRYRICACKQSTCKQASVVACISARLYARKQAAYAAKAVISHVVVCNNSNSMQHKAAYMQPNPAWSKTPPANSITVCAPLQPEFSAALQCIGGGSRTNRGLVCLGHPLSACQQQRLTPDNKQNPATQAHRQHRKGALHPAKQQQTCYVAQGCANAWTCAAAVGGTC